MIQGEVFRYAVAGVLAVACDATVLYVATEYFDRHYLVSNILGYFAGLIVSYLLNINWVFRYRQYKERTLLEFSIFSVIVFVGLGISESVIYLMVTLGGFYYMHAKIAATIIVTMYNYLTKKFLLFRPAPGTINA